MTALVLVAAGVVLVAAGVGVLFGWPWVLVLVGVLLVGVGLCADLEALSGKSDRTSPR